MVAPSTTTTTGVPDGLPFVELEAVDDAVAFSGDTELIDVLANDVFGDEARVVSVSQPDIGSVSLDGSSILVDVPDSYAGELRFSYTIADGVGNESSAMVTVVSTNVLGSVSELVETDALVGSVGEQVGRLGSQIVGLINVRLSMFQVTVLGVAPLLLGLLWLVFGRRERLMAITNTPLSEVVELEHGSGSVPVRHDALVWSRERFGWGRSLERRVFVETKGGQRARIDPQFLHDTGY